MKYIKCTFLTKEKETELVKQYYATGDLDARNRVVMGVYPFLVGWLSKRSQKSHTLEDMVNTAVMAALQCLEDRKYNPDLCRFSTYVTMPIHNELRKMGGIVKTPQNGTWYKSEKARDSISCARMIQTNIEDEWFEGGIRSGPNLDETDESFHHRLCLDELVLRLSKRDKSILLDMDTYIEIGKKHGITRQRVEQIKSKAIKKFRQLVGNW